VTRRLNSEHYCSCAMNFDVIVLGTSSEALEAAVAAGRLGARVALVEPWMPDWFAPGGAPQWLQRMRDSIASCTRTVFPDSPRRRSQAGLPSPAVLAEEAVEREACAHRVVQQRLDRLQVQSFAGKVRFLGADQVALQFSGREMRLSSPLKIVATGSRTEMPAWAVSDGGRIFSVDEVATLREIPRSLMIVGGGATGLEASFLFSLLGTRVTLIDRRHRLPIGPGVSGSTILRQLQRLGVRVLLDSEVTMSSKNPDGSVSVELLSGDRLSAERLLVTTERRGRTADLGLEELGVRLDERSRLWCDEQLQTWCSGLVGLGDVVGHPRELAESPLAPRELVWFLLGHTPDRAVVDKFVASPVPFSSSQGN